MTVSTNVNKVSYAGNGSTTAFALGAGFVFFDSSELRVIVTVDATGVETLQTITTDYTVSGGAGLTGTVTMLVAPASGETLTIRRVMPLTQTSDLVNNDTQDAEVVEDMADKNTLGLQQLDEELARTLRLPESETADATIPSAVDRKNKILAFENTDAALPRVTTAADVTVPLSEIVEAFNASTATPAANKLAYFTAAEDADVTDFTAFARTFLDDADSDAVKITLAVLSAANGSWKVVSGTTAQRDGSPIFGYLRANTDISQMEWYDGSNWTGLGGASGAGGDAIFYENDQNVTTNYTITTNKNAMSAGPIEIDSGITVTVPSGSTWTIV